MSIFLGWIDVDRGQEAPEETAASTGLGDATDASKNILT